MANKQDSNFTGLSYAEEQSLKTLPVTPVWYPLEPNSYGDFGGQTTMVARDPINPSRQRKKGVITDLDASGSFTTDFVRKGLKRLMQGFFFADWHQKPSTQPLNSAAVPITSVDGTLEEYVAASGLGIFAADDLVLASGFALANNNGLKVVSAATATSVTVTGLDNEASPPSTAQLQKVGLQFGSAELDVAIVSGLPRLSRASGTLDFSAQGLSVGEWIFIGGDTAGTKFVNAVNNCYARIKTINAAYLEFDKTSQVMVAETGTGLTVQVFFGDRLQNEPVSANIKRRSYQLERQLGNDANGVMSEYLVGAVPNQLTFNSPQADKATAELSFVACDAEQRDGTTGVKTGTRATLDIEDAYNTSSDYTRIKMALISAADAAPTPLFAYLTELTLTINNNVTPNKAVAVLGAFDQSAGEFEVGGKVTAYFADVAAVQAVRNNSDVTIDMILVKKNAGIIFDIPLLSLGDGRLAIEKNKPITLPLDMSAGQSTAGHTLLMMDFPYLPALADT